MFCDMYDDKKLKEQMQARVNYVKNEESFQKIELKGLKKTLTINKEIITLLLKDKLDHKQVLSKLNEENIYLLNQIQLLKKQRDTYHGKNLIAEQVIAELKYKARNEFKDYKHTAINFIDELDNKEFVIQNLQYKYNKLEKVIRKYAKQDSELAALLEEFDGDKLKHSRKITSIIHENKKLTRELEKVKRKVCEFEQRLRNDSRNLEINPFKCANTTREEHNNLVATERCKSCRPNDNIDWVKINTKVLSKSTSKNSSIDPNLNIDDDDIDAILVIMDKMDGNS